MSVIQWFIQPVNRLVLLVIVAAFFSVVGVIVVKGSKPNLAMSEAEIMEFVASRQDEQVA